MGFVNEWECSKPISLNMSLPIQLKHLVHIIMTDLWNSIERMWAAIEPWGLFPNWSFAILLSRFWITVLSLFAATTQRRAHAKCRWHLVFSVFSVRLQERPLKHHQVSSNSCSYPPSFAACTPFSQPRQPVASGGLINRKLEVAVEGEAWVNNLPHNGP